MQCAVTIRRSWRKAVVAAAAVVLCGALPAPSLYAQVSGYGDKQTGPIPPNSVLVFRLKLVSILGG